MIRQLKQSHVLRELWPDEMRLAYAGHGQGATAPRRPFAAPAAAAQLPRRPDASALSEAIPLYFIGRNKNGLWVVREAEGRSGGLFFLKQSAVHFARRQSQPSGCAMMFLDEPIELDIADQRGRHAMPASTEKAARRAPICHRRDQERRCGMAEANRKDFARFRQPALASRGDRTGAIPRPVYAVLEERRRSADPVIRRYGGPPSKARNRCRPGRTKRHAFGIDDL